ncbi:class I SAM-dependent methyltransferase [Helicobacter cappadocius]|uniref:Class I SAM-dependent methyltransferase n=1 Tax=Helicobacter cappadocius TaxID=3063998 RepID=A0AA90PXH0_9HELI|nr:MULTISPECIES: class I SAM-dependent methyltransferase [unclassified Helicobacter]MDO7252501.1 class I SAM-dependent methyltransferase [Helicobacter sp. faydin-H75]MDP2538368.1 class I SAM-dependent methyltransferase [Helicobacter sp. faydin-H76]
MDKIGILGYGKVGQNFYALCADMDTCVYIYDDFYSSNINNSFIGTDENELKNCEVIVICSAKKHLRDDFYIKTITLGIHQEKIHFYTGCFYPSYWLTSSIKEYFNHSLIECLSKDTLFLTELKKTLKTAFENIPKPQKENSFYDDIYLKSEMYLTNYDKTPYYPGWKYALKILQDFGMQKAKVLDIGCGNGAFAKMLYENNILSYEGIDFSDEGLKIAREQIPSWSEYFIKEDIFESKIFEKNFTHIIIFEVLEHINDDIRLLSKIKPKTTIIGSIPNFHSEGHIRIFEDITEIKKRYEPMIKILDFFELKLNEESKIFYFKAIKK